TQVALAWTNLGQPNESARIYDPTADTKFLAAMRTVSYRKPEWALDGGVVFLGLAKWDDKIESPKPSAAAAASDVAKSSDSSKPTDAAKDKDAEKSKEADKNKDKDEDEPPTVAVWNWRDVEVMPKQKLNAKNDRQKNMLAAWHVEKNSLIPLGKDLEEE